VDIVDFLFSISPIPAICFVAGLILLIFEMFHPGFGVPGAMGLLLLVVGVILSARTFTEALILVVIILALLGIALSFILHSASKGFIKRKLVLSHASKKEAGYIGTEDLEYFLGKEGVAVTVLRPSGTANFDGVKVDVVTEGDFVAKGAQIKVIKVEGRRIVVRSQGIGA
jgi:membrane-bound ClpP family serine protease